MDAIEPISGSDLGKEERISCYTLGGMLNYLRKRIAV